MIDKKFIFIGGLHRSGTSILYKILGTCDEISKHVNTQKPENEGQHIQTVYDAACKHKGVGSFCFDKGYHMTEKSKLINNKNKKKLYGEWSKYWDVNKNILLEKSPPNIIHMRFLQEMFDDTYFIIIVRDPLSNAKSTAKFVNKKKELSTEYCNKLIKHWIVAHNIMLNDAEYIKNLIIIKYDDLCDDYNATINKVNKLLNVQLHVNNKKMNVLPTINNKNNKHDNNHNMNLALIKHKNKIKKIYDRIDLYMKNK